MWELKNQLSLLKEKDLKELKYIQKSWVDRYYYKWSGEDSTASTTSFVPTSHGLNTEPRGARMLADKASLAGEKISGTPNPFNLTPTWTSEV